MEQRRLKEGIHTFVVCAYKESPYLEECMVSLKNQTLLGEIIMVTSTPNEYISDIASKYGIELYINDGEGGIAQDWNFGIEKCRSCFVTIAHQDDVYGEDYLREILRHLRKREDALIAFSAYGEIRSGKKTKKSVLTAIKRIMLLPLCVKKCQGSKFIKRRILSVGNPICCPSVTYCMKKLKKPIFEVKYGSNLDWQTWTNLANHKGAFVYLSKPLMYHRIHEESATSGLINNHERAREDLDMLEQFWPKPVAAVIAKLYGTGEKLNK